MAGFNTEYPTVYFSLFFMAEYSNIIALSEVASISFYDEDKNLDTDWGRYNDVNLVTYGLSINMVSVIIMTFY